MVSEMEKPRITEIKVRMDCNGCVQKIKKALQGITGICDLYIDFPQQKITIIGWEDPVAMVKAIKKTRKSAVICSHMDQPTEPANESGTPEGGAPPPEHTNPPAEQEAGPPVEEPHDSPPPEPKPSTESANATSQPTQPSRPKDAEEIHVVYRYPPPEYGYTYENLQQSNGPGFRDEPFQPYARGPGYSHPAFGGESFQPYARGPGYSHPGFGGEPFQPYARGPVYSHPGFGGEPFQPYARGPGYSHQAYGGEPSQPYTRCTGHRYEPPQPYTGGPGFIGETSQHDARGLEYRDKTSQPIYVTHSYNTYKPSPYVTEYAYPRSPPRYSHYSIPDQYSQDYHGANNGNITSMFSEENPNACRIA